ncbi:MAG TPA: pteridine reductase [Steroidobacteraceae bacterium]|nr:pteridine reductase [Steroidobacteraceae bacterium]HRX90769.1 pteridine reductase [Steroidobacteraceae bacterium]
MDDATSLTGRTVLITGAAVRVGAAMARAFHAAGANLVLHYRSSVAQAQKLAEELEVLRRGSTQLVRANLLDTTYLPTIVQSAVTAFGRLDVLVNNASSFYPTPVGSITEQQWQDLMGSNVKAPLFLSQAAAPHLRVVKGQIINIVDIHGTRPLRNHPVYSTAKAALVMLTRSLAKELAPEIRVNGIAPGPVLWPVTGADEELRANIVDRTLLKRMGSPDDIARTALFLAANAPFMTGQILAVDGGRSVAW